ncbi:FAD binding domain-containing protein [Methylobacterium pseudosasicola]|uniref:CO or xanthine dehydrogenase, FAD-binding subunit n=1 Tax=Methylobacterium pseudosasicola TaxID=582667 RepID=A0A1I4QZ29_9HYPH|nr:FAD binding domain-containing protein [Methylobacterium pseudosasicola]SFM44986.1 CO or xanthine dehydrogenase, FAD-binding subunit [Methylobacterium pseudosasicola]
MDLNTIETVLRPQGRADLPDWRNGDACLAGGTWLFSEPQPGTRRLVDLTALGWTPHAITPEGLTLAATCTIAQLDRLELPPDWIAAPLVGQCCRALLGSFKIWNLATVGGNLCMALPAGPMTALAAALEATCTVWAPDGGERHLPVTEFVLGPQRNALRPGEILRSLVLPATALTRRTAFRRISLSPNGRSGALLIGTRDSAGAFALTITASIRRPVRLAFANMPDRDALGRAIAETIPNELYYDDVHGTPDWRQHMTRHLAEEIRAALADEASA